MCCLVYLVLDTFEHSDGNRYLRYVNRKSVLRRTMVSLISRTFDNNNL